MRVECVKGPPINIHYLRNMRTYESQEYILDNALD